MRIEVNNMGDHIALVERMAQRRDIKPYVITVDLADGRTAAQNDLMWPSLREISKQVMWHGEKLSPEDWKDVFTAALRKQRAVPGIEGGLVFLGLHTSKISKQEMSDLMELIFSFGTDHNVEFKESNDGI